MRTLAKAANIKLRQSLPIKKFIHNLLFWHKSLINLHSVWTTKCWKTNNSQELWRDRISRAVFSRECIDKFTFRWAQHFTDKVSVQMRNLSSTNIVVCLQKIAHEIPTIAKLCGWKVDYLSAMLSRLRCKSFQWCFVLSSFLVRFKIVRRRAVKIIELNCNQFVIGKSRGSDERIESWDFHPLKSF